MKITKSKDGHLRANIQVTFRVGLQEMMCAVYQLMSESWSPTSDKHKISRSAAEAKLRCMLEWGQVQRDGFWDDIASEEQKAAQDKTIELFPELRSQIC